MNIIQKIADVVEAFKSRGFKYIGKTDGGKFRLHGELNLKTITDKFECEIHIDPDFVDLPYVLLLTTLDNYPSVIPHIGHNKDLCYINKGTVTLNIFDPVKQSLACLEKAESVLEKSLKGEMIDDISDEFFAYWVGPICFYDMQSTTLGKHDGFKINKEGIKKYCVTDDKNRTVKKLQKLFNNKRSVWDKVYSYRIKTNVNPTAGLRSWPPKTVNDILDWQATLEISCKKEIYKKIKEGIRKRYKNIIIIIESPLIIYGFEVQYGHISTGLKPKINAHLNKLKVQPLSFERIDDKYIAQRNIPNLKTLSGKKIAIIGCGTIGSYLAEMLVKTGAGTCGGKLTLVDFDILLPQNLGRHRLGFADIFKNKAESMKNELVRIAPTANISSFPHDVRTTNLDNIDLLIDATGEEALGHWLCLQYLRQVSMLTVWIEGPGTAIRALLRTSKVGACYRCLYHTNKDKQLLSTVEPLSNILEGQGCEGLYVPFPSSVSVQAASLALEIALDWTNDNNCALLRTKLIDQNKELATFDCCPLPHPECPICSS